jgi:hypothetical protein
MRSAHSHGLRLNSEGCSSGQIQRHDCIRVTHIGESPSLTFLRETDAWETWKSNGVAAA